MHLLSRNLTSSLLFLSKSNNMATSSSTSKLSQIPDIDIDEGRFKYILIKVSDPDAKEDKYIVRGYTDCSFHKDIYDKVEPNIKKLGLKMKCPGGGRILHDSPSKSIMVFGYSQGFGRANHKTTCELLKKKYPEYIDINWSNDGY